MSKKPNGVAVEMALHGKVKSAAPLRGTNLEGAYDQALRSWLSREANPFPNLTDEEEKAINAMILMMRDESDDFTKGTITRLLDKWMGKVKQAKRKAS